MAGRLFVFSSWEGVTIFRGHVCGGYIDDTRAKRRESTPDQFAESRDQSPLEMFISKSTKTSVGPLQNIREL